jgi:dipeptidyl aminopeptidase/acylaminoacyl peptidase
LRSLTDPEDDPLRITLIRPNVRGSSGYGKRFAADNGKLREDSVRDIGALLDWIAAQPELDASRVMVIGGSYGGYMTLASMARFSDRLRCGVDIVGIANWVTFLERTEAYRRDLRRVEYGDERIPEMRDFLSTISPVNHAHKITRPMLIIQGKNDPRVPYTESEQMVAAIRKNQGKVWYVLASDEGHGFRKKANRDYQMAAIALFVKQNLLN